jgi:mono/diheme cytochrome c family protein
MLALLIGLAVLALASPGGAETAVERGRYLVEVLGACGNCHTPKGPAGDLPDQHLAGGFIIAEKFGTAVSPNLTPDPDTGLGRWSDEEIIRAIREGKRRDGRTLGPPMPYAQYRALSDTDARAIVAYLRTVRRVRNRVAPSRYRIPLPAAYGPPVDAVPEVSRADAIRYGEYLAGPVAHCVECHTARRPDGTPDTTRFAAGGFPFQGPLGVSYSSNLTPDPDTGLGRWSDDRIVASIYGARHDGGRVWAPMPSSYYAAGIAPEDLRAILSYLRSLPPIRHPVAAPEPWRSPAAPAGAPAPPMKGSP